jgi:hypothetical protein
MELLPMKIFNEIKQLVRTEKMYTAKILTKLMIVEKDKLYSDLKYSSLHKYIIKELGYSEAEATLRVNAVRLMLKSKKAKKKIEAGTLSLTNAAVANKAIQSHKDQSFIDEIVEDASKSSTRKFKERIAKELNCERREVLVLQEHMIKKFDKLRKIYGDLSSYELLSILLEKELCVPGKVQRVRKCSVRNSRSIPKQVKAKVYTGKCKNCGVKHGLEYDHILKHSHGGTNSADNIQILCRNCNQRKEIIAKQMNLFC